MAEADARLARSRDGFGPSAGSSIYAVPVVSGENNLVGLAYRVNGLDEDEARAINRLAAYSTDGWRRLRLSYDAALYCDRARVEGDIVVCGVWRGASAAAAAAGHLARGMPARRVRVADPFNSASLSGEKASFAVPRKMGAKYKSPVALVAEDAGYPLDMIDLYDEWFDDAGGLLDFNGRVALLDLDGDFMYAGGALLRRLLTLVALGGVVVTNDYPETNYMRDALSRAAGTLGFVPFFAAHETLPGGAISFVKTVKSRAR
jgi:hypothetical protein